MTYFDRDEKVISAIVAVSQSGISGECILTPKKPVCCIAENYVAGT